MSKLKVQDYDYDYPKDLINQWKTSGEVPEVLKEKEIAFLIKDGDYLLTSKTSKIAYKNALKLRDRYKKEIEDLQENEFIEFRNKSVDIDAFRKNGRLLIKHTCHIFTWDNLNDALDANI